MGHGLFHLIWGVTLFCLYLSLAGLLTPLMRVTPPLAPSQTYALIADGEVVSFLPYLPKTKQKWSIVKKAQWITFVISGGVQACTFFWGIYCTQHMPLGEKHRL